MRAVVLAIALAACSFSHGERQLQGDGGGNAGPDSSGDGDGGVITPGIDAQTCAWSYTPTNFDPCMLPPPVTFTVTGTVTVDTTNTTLPKKVQTQSDGTTLTVIHLSQLKVNGFSTLTLTGSAVVLAVDGEVSIDGTVVAIGGNDDEVQCATSIGTAGTDSQNNMSGAGGGGGGGATADGGGGGNGDGAQRGLGGARGVSVTNTYTPLRAGCSGGAGGRFNGAGQTAGGGRGGGAVQISTNNKISIGGAAAIDAAGRGGGGGPAAHAGGGGGGSGGAIFLEGPQIDLGFASLLCADGGSGGEGGGATVAGQNGRVGCTAFNPAQTPNTQNSAGGDGGDGGFRFNQGGQAGASSTTSAGGGGGGGGGAGWIRVKTPNKSDDGAVITPASN